MPSNPHSYAHHYTVSAVFCVMAKSPEAIFTLYCVTSEHYFNDDFLTLEGFNALTSNTVQ